MDKKIILDCDGVLLEWAYACDVWMGGHGHKRIPNTNHHYSQSLRYGITEKESFRQIKVLMNLDVWDSFLHLEILWNTSVNYTDWDGDLK